LPQSSGASVEGAPLSAEAEAAFQELRTRLQAPAMRARVHGEGTEVTFAAVQPLTLVLGRRAERLARPELDFLLARALEQARAGTLAVARLSVGDLRGLLRGVIRAVSLQSGESDGEQDPEGERASAWAARLSAPEVARLMPEGKEGADLLLEAGEALARPPDLEGYVRGCRFTADRIGLLACGSPLVALRSLAAALKAPEPAVGQGLSIQRQEQVRSSAALRELVAFMLSEEYAASIAPA
jgi:hypothetical protein